MRHVAPVGRELPLPTLLNLLGPLILFAKVMLVARSAETLRRIAEEIREKGGQADWFVVPAQRPLRGSSPGSTRRVHGRQPIEG